MRAAEQGDHKGRPYDVSVGAYFRSNDREAAPGYSYNHVLPTPVSPAGERRWSAVRRIHTCLTYMESHSSGRTGV